MRTILEKIPYAEWHHGHRVLLEYYVLSYAHRQEYLGVSASLKLFCEPPCFACECGMGRWWPALIG